ncbi:MAG: DUF3370 domain-containing protein [Synechococcales bacterium]|nr:DUF3370 domain-containing protein [Synechococcales bacterium]
MLSILTALSLAQLPAPLLPLPAPAPPPDQIAAPLRREVLRQQAVMPLPGQLDNVPVFNSNSPELVQTEGILLSTFPPDGMAVPSAHLNYAFDGRFDVFAHHIARGLTPDDNRTLYMGILVHNPNRHPVSIDVLQAASYLSQDAPFNNLPPYVANPLGTVFSGPGSRTMNDMLRGFRQASVPSVVQIPPRHTHLLLNVPIPLRRLSVPTDGTLPPGRIIPTPLPPEPEEDETDNLLADGTMDTAIALLEQPNDPPATKPPVPDNRPLPSNGRSALFYLLSSGPVYVASLSMFAPTLPSGTERVPTLYEWQQVLRVGGLAGPRDYPPTPPDAQRFSRFFYGRVAGVAAGSQWVAQLTDEGSDHLTIPDPGDRLSYALSTVDYNTFGTGQIQSAPILARYPDTAYRAHGNYGIKYDISMPLHNSTDEMQTVSIALETPIQNETTPNTLVFLDPPDDRVFFRGTVRIRYVDDWRIPETRYLHLVQRRGQQGEPLIRLRMPPGDRRLVQVEFLYPPDATPPQVLTVHTQGEGR